MIRVLAPASDRDIVRGCNLAVVRTLIRILQAQGIARRFKPRVFVVKQVVINADILAVIRRGVGLEIESTNAAAESRIVMAGTTNVILDE